MAVSPPPGHKLNTETDIVASTVSGHELWRGARSCGDMTPAGPLTLPDVHAAHLEHITTHTDPAPRPAAGGRKTIDDVVADAGDPHWRALDRGWLHLTAAPGDQTHTLEFSAFGDLLDVPHIFTNPLEPSTVAAMVIRAPDGAELIVAAVCHPDAPGAPGRWELRTHDAGTFLAWGRPIGHNHNPAGDPTAPLLTLTLPDRCTCDWWLGFRAGPATTTPHVRAG